MRAGFKGVIAGSMLVAVGTAYSDKEAFLLSFHGFEPDAYTEEGQAGLAQILSGKMFDFQVPMSAVNFRRSIAVEFSAATGKPDTVNESFIIGTSNRWKFSRETAGRFSNAEGPGVEFNSGSIISSSLNSSAEISDPTVIMSPSA